MSLSARLIDQIDRALEGNTLNKVGVAVSGGSDSLALMHLLHAWGKAPIAAATVDHGLRPEAAEEARQVSKMATDLGIPHKTLEWRDWDGKGNLQDQARQSRYSLLAEWGAADRCDTIVLGHTIDDQAETFLMRLARASGVDALGGMDQRIWRNDQRFDRPLLDARRTDLQAYLEEKGVDWIEDPSNDDDRFSRIKARKALAHLEGLGLSPEDIGHSMVNLRLAGTELRNLAREIAQKICKEVAGDLVFDRAGLRRLNPEMQFRLVSNALKFVSSELYPPRRDAIYEAEAAIHDLRNHTLHGCLILVSDVTVRITREFNAVDGHAKPTDGFWDNRWCLTGPHAPDLEIRALGDAVKDTPWRETGMPRQSLLASPAVWRNETLVAAPVAGLSNGWTAKATGRGKFADFLLRR